MGLDAAESRRLHFAYFPSGHEVYLNHDALVQFKADLSRSTEPPSRTNRHPELHPELLEGSFDELG